MREFVDTPTLSIGADVLQISDVSSLSNRDTTWTVKLVETFRQLVLQEKET